MAPAWLPLDVTLAAAEAAARRGVSKVARSPGQFLDQYEGAGGDPARLDPYWRRRRDAFVARHRAQLLSADTHREGWDDRGQPTRRHLALAVWAWSPTPGRLRRWLEGQVKRIYGPDTVDQAMGSLDLDARSDLLRLSSEEYTLSDVPNNIQILVPAVATADNHGLFVPGEQLVAALIAIGAIDKRGAALKPFQLYVKLMPAKRNKPAAIATRRSSTLGQVFLRSDDKIALINASGV